MADWRKKLEEEENIIRPTELRGRRTTIEASQYDAMKRVERQKLALDKLQSDDFEKVLRERYNENVVLAGKKETKEVNQYIEAYLRSKMKVRINDNDMNFIFIGKEYDVDIIQYYIEIQNVQQINSIEITNEVLFDLFEDQQNMIKTKINSKQKSFLLNQNNKIAVLNFN